MEDWPEVVSFGPTMEEIFCEKIIPLALRPVIIARLEQTIEKLEQATIEQGQKSNAINAVRSIVDNLKNLAYDQGLHQQFINFVDKMDSVKNLALAEYCPEMVRLLTVETC
jgi:hypothetical protein